MNLIVVDFQLFSSEQVCDLHIPQLADTHFLIDQLVDARHRLQLAAALFTDIQDFFSVLEYWPSVSRRWSGRSRAFSPDMGYPAGLPRSGCRRESFLSCKGYHPPHSIPWNAAGCCSVVPGSESDRQRRRRWSWCVPYGCLRPAVCVCWYSFSESGKKIGLRLLVHNWAHSRWSSKTVACAGS